MEVTLTKGNIMSKVTSKTSKNSLPSAAAINKTSQAIARAGKAWTKKVHEHAMLIARHIDAHDDVSIATIFCNLLPQGVRANALRDWFMVHGGCNWNSEKKAFTRKRGHVFNAAAADMEPWYELAKEPEFRPVDSMKLLEAALKRMKKALEDTDNKDRHKIDARHVKAIEAVLSVSE